MINNFGKPIQNLTETELLEYINISDPSHGVLASYELLRRISLEDSRSSKRFAVYSLTIAIIAIILSITASGVQIYLAWPK